MELKETNANHPDARKKDIVEEMNALNQRMQNPSNEIYKISSSWDKYSDAQSNKNIEIMLKEMMNHIIKMDAALSRIETVLSDHKSENKCQPKSFWDNFHL